MSPMTAPNALLPTLLEASGLTLSRGGRTLFEGLDLRAPMGRVVLVKGPNGAGKSSLLQVLAGILRPDSGRIDWRLIEPETPKLHYLGHASGMKTRLTAAENLRFWRTVNGPTGIAVSDALEQVGLGGLDDIEAGHLSAGQTRRLGLARLLVSQRPVWLLDEPTSALDTDGQALVGRMIWGHTEAGGAVVAATHDKIPQTGTATVLTLGPAT
jgi:heme exporter protein A